MKKILLRLGIISELFGFLWKNKLWWLIPIVFILLFITLFFYIAGSTGTAAFIYPIF